MKLYTCSTAPNPRRVEIFIAEKGIEIDAVQIAVREGEHKQEAYRAIAPNAKVPALQLDDGSVLLESPSICLYLEELHPDPCLLGSTPEQKARIDMWSRRIELELMLTMAGAFRHTHPAMAVLEDQVLEYGKVSRKNAEKRLKILDRDLGKSEYVAGDTYSMADITLLCTLGFFGAVDKYDMNDFNEIQRWHKQVAARPAVVQVTQ